MAKVRVVVCLPQSQGPRSQLESICRHANPSLLDDKLLPQALAAPDNLVFTIVDAAGAPVGVLSFAVKT